MIGGGEAISYYFDNNSTSLIYNKDVKKEINDWISCGNASNILHQMGSKAHNKIEQCRKSIAKDLKIDQDELYFTSGATESNNIIIQGRINHFLETTDDKYTVISTSFEHPSVYNIFKHYEDNPRLEVIFVDPNLHKDHNFTGCVLPDDIHDAIKRAKYKIILMSVMHANNETGAIQDIGAIGALCRTYNI